MGSNANEDVAKIPLPLSMREGRYIVVAISNPIRRGSVLWEASIRLRCPGSKHVFRGLPQSIEAEHAMMMLCTHKARPVRRVASPRGAWYDHLHAPTYAEEL
jgi:hypothetical protein